jgi:hypothetical protein
MEMGCRFGVVRQRNPYPEEKASRNRAISHASTNGLRKTNLETITEKVWI